jgi:hypothetical protein
MGILDIELEVDLLSFETSPRGIGIELNCGQEELSAWRVVAGQSEAGIATSP